MQKLSAYDLLYNDSLQVTTGDDKNILIQHNRFFILYFRGYKLSFEIGDDSIHPDVTRDAQSALRLLDLFTERVLKSLPKDISVTWNDVRPYTQENYDQLVKDSTTQMGAKPIYLSVKRHHDDASALEFQLLPSYKGAKRLGSLLISLPWQWGEYKENGWQDFFALMNQTCTDFKPLFGYGGFGLSFSRDLYLQREIAPLVYEMTQAVPFLEASTASGVRVFSQMRGGGIRSAALFNILGEEYIEKLYGRDMIKAQLNSSDFIIRDYPHCLFIQPSITEPDSHRDFKLLTGEAEDGKYNIHQVLLQTTINHLTKKPIYSIPKPIYPEPMIKLAKVLKPIRLQDDAINALLGDYPYPKNDPRPTLDKHHTNLWLRRYDR